MLLNLHRELSIEKFKCHPLAPSLYAVLTCILYYYPRSVQCVCVCVCVCVCTRIVMWKSTCVIPYASCYCGPTLARSNKQGHSLKLDPSLYCSLIVVIECSSLHGIHSTERLLSLTHLHVYYEKLTCRIVCS